MKVFDPITSGTGHAAVTAMPVDTVTGATKLQADETSAAVVGRDSVTVVPLIAVTVVPD